MIPDTNSLIIHLGKPKDTTQVPTLIDSQTPWALIDIIFWKDDWHYDTLFVFLRLCSLFEIDDVVAHYEVQYPG